MDRITEIDNRIAELYGLIHDAIRDNSTGYRVDGIVDEHIAEIARLSVDRAHWTSK